MQCITVHTFKLPFITIHVCHKYRCRFRIIPVGINLRDRYEIDNIAASQGLNVIEIKDEPNLIENTDVILRPLYEGKDENSVNVQNPHKKKNLPMVNIFT